MNGGRVRIVYSNGRSVVPPTGYGSGGYGKGGYGTGISLGIGRTYTGATMTGPVGKKYTITVNALVQIPVGSIAVIGPTGSTKDYSLGIAMDVAIQIMGKAPPEAILAAERHVAALAEVAA